MRDITNSALLEQGAIVLHGQLTNQMRDLERRFPSVLGNGLVGAGRAPSTTSRPRTRRRAGGHNTAAPPNGSRRPISAAARKATSQRMKAYWAERRRQSPKRASGR